MRTYPVYKKLVVDTPQCYAGAIWRRDESGWACVRAAPVLEWMIGMTIADANARMKEFGYGKLWMDMGPTKPRLS